MKYDDTNIAHAYDRGRGHESDVLARWMGVVATHVDAPSVRAILDLGCGTGRFSEALATHFDAHVIGLDPSGKMLAQARRKLTSGRVGLVRASGEAIPVLNGSLDLVFMSMVFHHFDDAPLVARECRRVLRAGGVVFLRTGTRERIASYPYVDFFPSSRQIAERRLPTADGVRDTFERAGFVASAYEVVVQRAATSYAAYATKLATRTDSILAAVSAAEFEAGLAAMRAHPVGTEGPAPDEPIDVFVFRRD